MTRTCFRLRAAARSSRVGGYPDQPSSARHALTESEASNGRAGHGRRFAAILFVMVALRRPPLSTARSTEAPPALAISRRDSPRPKAENPRSSTCDERQAPRSCRRKMHAFFAHGRAPTLVAIEGTPLPATTSAAPPADDQGMTPKRELLYPAAHRRGRQGADTDGRALGTFSTQSGSAKSDLDLTPATSTTSTGAVADRARPRSLAQLMSNAIVEMCRIDSVESRWPTVKLPGDWARGGVLSHSPSARADAGTPSLGLTSTTSCPGRRSLTLFTCIRMRVLSEHLFDGPSHAVLE